MRSFQIPSIVVVACLVAAGPPAARAAIVVSDWSLGTGARDALGPSVVVLHETPTFPFAEVHTATDGPTSAQSAYDFIQGENFASLDFLFNHVRSGNESSWASSGGSVLFSVTQPLDYSISGSFVLSASGRISLSAVLYDYTDYPDDVFLYQGTHESNATPDESFTFGMPGGDVVSSEVGELSGTLLPGRSYYLGYSYLIENYPPGSGSASADGAFSFVLTPEPTSLTLLALAGLVAARRRR